MAGVEQGWSIRRTYLEILQPVMHEVGRLWQTGAISVGQEHYCTNVTQLIMSMLYPRLFTGKPKNRRMLAVCTPGELHELGLRMVADFFEMEGWHTDFLGASTPIVSVPRALEEKKTDLLAIGATMYFHLEPARRLIDAVRNSPMGENMPILAGGYAFKADQSLYRTIGADVTAQDAAEAVQKADELVARSEKA
jgi:methanogenic corrinoid protein MtbC1